MWLPESVQCWRQCSRRTGGHCGWPQVPQGPRAGAGHPAAPQGTSASPPLPAAASGPRVSYLLSLCFSEWSALIDWKESTSCQKGFNVLRGILLRPRGGALQASVCLWCIKQDPVPCPSESHLEDVTAPVAHGFSSVVLGRHVGVITRAACGLVLRQAEVPSSVL